MRKHAFAGQNTQQLVDKAIWMHGWMDLSKTLVKKLLNAGQKLPT